MAIKANLQIDQGSDYSTTINLTDETGEVISLTGYSGNSQIRRSYSSSNATAFAVGINETTGVVTLSLTKSSTANLVAGRYVYDVVLKNTSNVSSRIVEGVVTVMPSVTR